MAKEVNQHISAANYGIIAAGNITITHHTTVVQQPPFALQAPPAPPARSRGRLAGTGRAPITPAQRAMLALMRPLPKPQRIAVLDWMRCEFGSALVMDLAPRELQRLRAHLQGLRLGAAVGDVTMGEACAVA